MDCLRRWRNWIRPLCFVLYFIIISVALPLCIIQFTRSVALQAWFIGGLFVMMAVPISLWTILQHVVNYTCPDLQRHIIRILWMVPIYALNAVPLSRQEVTVRILANFTSLYIYKCESNQIAMWFALKFSAAAIYLDTIRECYEAYVIYNFMRYLLNFLHQEHPNLQQDLACKEPVKHLFPFCWLPTWKPGRDFLTKCKHGVLQYTVVRPTMTVIALLSELLGVYDEGDFNFSAAWSYIVIINNISQIFSLYCLVLFYKGTREELAPIKPISKFLCVKAVVFLSFWQAVAIAALVKLNVIPKDSTWVFYKDVKKVATGLQDFLICVEMFLASIAHYYSFSHVPYIDMAADNGNCCTSFLSMWHVGDVKDDLVDHAKFIRHEFRKKLRLRRVSADNSEYSPLLGSESSLRRGNYSQPSGHTTPLVTVESIPQDAKEDDAQSFSKSTGRTTPPVIIEPVPPGARENDAQSLKEADWEQSGETFLERSLTPSMNNFADFSSIVEGEDNPLL